MSMRRWTIVAVVLLAAADAPGQYEVRIERGRKALHQALAEANVDPPVFSFGVLALLKTAPENARHETLVDPALRKLIDRVRKEAERIDTAGWAKTHHGHYGMAAMVSCLAADDPETHQPVLRKLVDLVVKAQLPNGGWSYPGDGQVDTSVTQFVVVALWDAALAGIEVPMEVWDRALQYQLSTQCASGTGAGGFAYRPQVPADGKPVSQSATASMSVAGLSTMLIARSQLPSLLAPNRRPPLDVGRWVRPLGNAARPDYQPKCTRDAANAAIAAAERFLARVDGLRGEFAAPGRELYYCYGFERVSALMGKDLQPAWKRLAAYVTERQRVDGSWDGRDGLVPDTGMAIMCLGRVTRKKVEAPEIVLLRPSLGIGGQGIPGSQAGAGSRQAERFRGRLPLDIDEAVRVFSQPAEAFAEDAAGRVETLAEEPASEAVRRLASDPHCVHRLAYSRNAAVRSATLALLARTRDFRVAPILLDGLSAENAAVYAAARDGLRYLARDPEAFRLPAERGTPAQLSAAVANVRRWIAGLKLETPAAWAYGPTGDA